MPILQFENTPYEEVKPGMKRKIIHTGNLMMVLIDFTGGPWQEPDPFHYHPHEQNTYVAKGEIMFLCEGEEPQKLSAGDMFAVPSGLKHTIQLLSPEVRLIDCFTPVREDFLS